MVLEPTPQPASAPVPSQMRQYQAQVLPAPARVVEGTGWAGMVEYLDCPHVVHKGITVPFYLAEAKYIDQEVGTVFAQMLPYSWREVFAMRYFNMVNSVFNEEAYTIVAVNFQYPMCVHERRYQRTALLKYATPQLVTLTCCT